MKELEQRRIQHRIGVRSRVQALVDRSHEGQHHPSVLHLSGALVPAELKDMDQTAMYFPWGGTSANFTTELLFLDCFCCTSSLPLKSLTTETCSGTSIVARFRSQNGVSQNCLLLCQEMMPGSFSGDSLPCRLTVAQEEHGGSSVLSPTLSRLCARASDWQKPNWNPAVKGVWEMSFSDFQSCSTWGELRKVRVLVSNVTVYFV